jgi:hypothetical protein
LATMETAKRRPKPEECAYELYAVCNHHGGDDQGGHYTGRITFFGSAPIPWSKRACVLSNLQSSVESQLSYEINFSSRVILIKF